MVLIYDLISVLFLCWALLALALLVYSMFVTLRRQQRAALRVRLQQIFQVVVSEAGAIDLVTSDRLAVALQRLAGRNRECLRDFLVEIAIGLKGDALKPISETYQALRFAEEDIQAFQKSSWYRRADAAKRLGTMHCWSAIEVLTGALRDKDTEVRQAALCALTELGESRSLATVVLSLSSANGWQVLQVASKLRQLPLDLSYLLRELLQAAGPLRERREAVIKVVLELMADLGQRNEWLNARSARLAAAPFLNNESVDIRARAVRVFAALGVETNDELELLLAKMADQSWEVRAVAAKALGQIGKEQAIPALIRMLTDEAWWVRHNAAHSLAQLGQLGLAALREQTEHTDRFARDIAKQVIEELQLDAAVRTGS
ncbi:MAG: HEAT repeat domain-containing protein [Acidobacteriota bacterium]